MKLYHLLMIALLLGWVQPGTADTERQFPGIALEEWVTAPHEITYLTHAGDDRLFLVEKRGTVLIIENGELLATPFLDIVSLVHSGGSEQGLLSIAFDPDYAATGEFYVYYTDRAGDGDNVVARYQVTDDPNAADHQSGEILLTIDDPARNHNGGQLQFGKDGYLYIGTGDGGSAGDPWDNAENPASLLGKMLRIDVREQEMYAIPADNPFAENSAFRPEIWAYGLRNPWRFSFDRVTGDLYIGDVGQNQFEEINFQFADSPGGENYGWNMSEGFSCYETPNCDLSAVTLPSFVYPHSQGCSVTGGYVYRGAAFPAMQGVYFFADYCNGVVWGMQGAETGTPTVEMLLNTGVNIASFGEDMQGELYILDLSGIVYRLVEG